MDWIRPVAIGAGATLAGIGVASQTMKFAENRTARVGERYWDRQRSGEDGSATDYYGGSSVLLGAGAIALGVGGVGQLARPALAQNVRGAALLVGAGAVAGYAVGGFKGFAAGESASAEKHGTNIQDQSDLLLRNFDRDKDGVLSTKNDAFPEYLYKYEVDYRRDSLPDLTKWASIEKFVKAADGNGDSKVDRQELVDKMSSYDANGNGLLSATDGQKLRADGLESVAIQSQIIEFDPWGAVIPVKW